MSVPTKVTIWYRYSALGLLLMLFGPKFSSTPLFLSKLTINHAVFHLMQNLIPFGFTVSFRFVNFIWDESKSDKTVKYERRAYGLSVLELVDLSFH